MNDFQHIPETLPRHAAASKDNDAVHHYEWLAARKGEGKALSHLGHACPMTEAVLLGNVALRAGQRIEWNTKKLKVTNVRESNQLIRREYQKGWESPV